MIVDLMRKDYTIYMENKRGIALATPLVCLVGMRGFEPPVSASRTQRSTSLSHIPKKNFLAKNCGLGKG